MPTTVSRKVNVIRESQKELQENRKFQVEKHAVQNTAAIMWEQKIPNNRFKPSTVVFSYYLNLEPTVSMLLKSGVLEVDESLQVLFSPLGIGVKTFVCVIKYLF